MILLGLIVMVTLILLNSAPAAFFGMLFLGNLGTHVGFWAVLPGVIAWRLITHNIFSLDLRNKLGAK